MIKTMVLKVKEVTKGKTRFQEKKSARLFNDDEMEKLVDMAAAAIRCGCDVKVELKEMEMTK